jgi:predicted transcriptional regulator
MPTTDTARMRQIAEDLWEAGFYTASNSVHEITDERDRLIKELTELRAGA